MVLWKVKGVLLDKALGDQPASRAYMQSSGVMIQAQVHQAVRQRALSRIAESTIIPYRS